MTLALNKQKLDYLADEIWKFSQRLRGKFKAYEYQNVILPILVIRRLECVLIKWREEKAAEVLAKRPKLKEKELAKLVKGLETLDLRVRRQAENARQVADFLAGRPGIARVLYPGRADHPQHALAARQMDGGGTMAAFDVEGGRAGAFRFMNALRLIDISNNLGDAKSLITHPATTTHERIGAEERARMGIGDGLLRLSVGLEDPADLCEDLALACRAARNG